MNKRRMTKAAVLSAAGIATLPQLLNLKGNITAVSNSWVSVILWAFCFYALYKVWDKVRAEERKISVAGLAYGFFLSLCLVLGSQLERWERVEFTSLLLWMSVAIWTVIFGLGVCFIWRFLDRVFSWLGEKSSGEKIYPVCEWWNRQGEGRRTILLFFFLLICWLPVFLAVYPGFFVYDAQDEFVQAVTRNFTTHHPLPHVALLGGVILLVNKVTGSYNLGIAVYTVLQMLFMAAVFTGVIRFMKKSGLRPAFLTVSSLYFAFFPVIVMFTLCSAKDGIFTTALLILIMYLMDMAMDEKRFFSSIKGSAGLAVSGVIMISFRHNGLYALLAFTPFVIWVFKGYRKKNLVLFGSIFAVYFLLSAGLTAFLGAKDAGKQEMFTVPIQQLARVHQFNRDSFSDADRELLYQILPEEALDNYVPKVSDGVKYWFDTLAFSQSPMDFIGLWLRMGIKHPATYMNAWLMTSYGFWYPDTIIDVYRGNSAFTFTYEDSSFFGYEVEQPGTRESKIPWLNEWYRRMSLEVTQQNIPVVSMLFSPGFLFWVYALMAGYVFCKSKKKLLMPMLLMFLVWLTVLLGPTYVPRYVLFLWFNLPILVNLGHLCYTTHDLDE